MATTNSIVQLALSKLGVSGGTKAPRQADLDLALTTFKSVFRGLISSGTLGRARAVTPQGDYTARENDRILRTIDYIGEITLPQTVRDDCEGSYGCWEYYDYPTASCPRPPRDGSFVLINDANTGQTEEWIYEGYSNRWISLHDLSLDDGADLTDSEGHVIGTAPISDAPLSYRDENGLAALLATKLADHYGATPSPLTMKDAEAFLISLANGFGEAEDELWNPLF